MAEELVEERLYFDDPRDAEAFRKAAAEFGLTVTEEPSDAEHIAPLIILAIGGGAAAVAGALTYWSQLRKGGQMIDLRESPPKVWRDKGLVYGLVVVVLQDGSVKIEVHEPKGFFLEVVNSVIGAVKDIAEKGIETVTKAAEAAVGDKASVSVEPPAAGV